MQLHSAVLHNFSCLHFVAHQLLLYCMSKHNQNEQGEKQWKNLEVDFRQWRTAGKKNKKKHKKMGKWRTERWQKQREETKRQAKKVDQTQGKFGRTDYACRGKEFCKYGWWSNLETKWDGRQTFKKHKDGQKRTRLVRTVMSYNLSVPFFPSHRVLSFPLLLSPLIQSFLLSSFISCLSTLFSYS